MRRAERHDSFERLYDAHFADVLAFALRRAPDPADAADVTAETFLVAWRRLPDVPAGAAARAWLFGVTRRALANARRGSRRRDGLADRLRAHLERELPALELAGGPSGPLREALDALTAQEREVLLLVAWEGLDPAEVAIVLAIPAATARTRLHRARARLRARLDELGDQPGAHLSDVMEVTR